MSLDIKGAALRSAAAGETDLHAWRAVDSGAVVDTWSTWPGKVIEDNGDAERISGLLGVNVEFVGPLDDTAIADEIIKHRREQQ
jgi:hypothetical protein